MRPVDEIALESLRKADGGQTPPEVWDEITKQVEARGIDNLTGSAAIVVKGIVVKHGKPGSKGFAAMHSDTPPHAHEGDPEDASEGPDHESQPGDPAEDAMEGEDHPDGPMKGKRPPFTPKG